LKTLSHWKKLCGHFRQKQNGRAHGHIRARFLKEIHLHKAGIRLDSILSVR
jgi:hypothetical protein